MPNIKQLRETREESHKAMAALLTKAEAESRDLNAEETEQWNKAEADYNALTGQIQRAETLAKMETESRTIATQRPVEDGRVDGDIDDRDDKGKGETRITADEQMAAFRGWVRHQAQRETSDEERAACQKAGISLGSRDIEINLPDSRTAKRFYSEYRANPYGVESRALSAVIGASGGFTVPEGFVPEWERALLAFGGSRAAYTLMRTTSGNDLPWPTTDDTSNKGEQIGENATVTEQDVTVSQKVLHAYKFTSKMVKVPVELLEDSAFDIAATLGSMLGERIGRILAEKQITGTGAATPEGILTAAPLGHTTAGAGVLAADDLIQHQHTVDPAYRMNAGWVMHDDVVSAIRRMKGNDNSYLFFDAQRGEFSFDRLLGSPVFVDQEMPNTPTVSTTKIALYGDLSKHMLREVRGIRLRRLVERFADSDQEAFLAFVRFDSKLLDAGTGPVKHLVIQ